jgi:protoheme ferro-lyase
MQLLTTYHNVPEVYSGYCFQKYRHWMRNTSSAIKHQYPLDLNGFKITDQNVVPETISL